MLPEAAKPLSVEDEVDICHYAVLELHARNDNDDIRDSKVLFLVHVFVFCLYISKIISKQL